MLLIRLLLLRGHAPRCCAQPMDWDVIRASYVCGSCGAAR
ncbi:hypothetical protein SAMN05421803_14317 [Nocardiopsis flavescens]|uniref:Uncharacterized protein n=1 Tax=Nocardiopsis flavescens TaxID=758803 RepID=A0A1M6WFS7_9ACTN|nr:hypothetical protein SAMN05421803_14317 [Nocardiopsis flavescens]